LRRLDQDATERRGSATPKVVAILAVTALFYLFLGFYSIQPIGALPEGRTLLVWRGSGEPFFNSPDAVCLDRMGYVSLMCRSVAMGQGPIDRIVLRLPYLAWAYSVSVNGRDFDE
jgi:hypothetical protein